MRRIRMAALGVLATALIAGTSGRLWADDWQTAWRIAGRPYVLTEIGVLGFLDNGYGGSMAYALNDCGQIVGHSTTGERLPDRNAVYHAFLWQNATLTDLGTLPGYTHSYALGINNQGQVVGTCYASNWSSSRACLWDNGQIIDLGTLGGPASGALGINDLGQIVGYSKTAVWAPPSPGIPQHYISHAFVCYDGQMQDLDTLSGYIYSSASAINNQGQIVGLVQGDRTLAVMWHEGQITDLGGFGGRWTSAEDINNLGVVVGKGSNEPNNDWSPYLFRWEDGIFAEIPTPSEWWAPGGGCYKYVEDVGGLNDLGQITLTVEGGDSPHGFILDGDYFGDLNDLFVSVWSGVITQATDINNLGQIVGQGWRVEGLHPLSGEPWWIGSALLLTPIPEPGTLSLLGLSLLGTLVRRRSGKGRREAC